jgi:CelD/BcsL family acetyltransferase involved in cellulose biosynthesis
MLDISLSRPAAWNALGVAWRALEARSHGSFFQSWSWVGCRAAERFADPQLLVVRRGGDTVALGLFNRRHRRLVGGTRLWLNESGTPELDSIHVEHNGLLIADDAPAGTLVQALAHASRHSGAIMMSGVDGAHLAAAREAGATVHLRASTGSSPWIDLAAVRSHPGGHLGLLSANTRQQIRRSIRRYAAFGDLEIRRAATLDEAQADLAALAVLHQRSWTSRGQPGAFANPNFVAFHRELLARAWPRGEIDLLRIGFGGRLAGYLYNFRWRDRIANYQSGFDYAAADSAQQKPGLTCHHLAAEAYAAEGLAAYDLLAGEHRYKTSLATSGMALHWLELFPATSLSGLVHRMRAAMGDRRPMPWPFPAAR